MIDIAFRARRSKRFGANILSIEKPKDKMEQKCFGRSKILTCDELTLLNLAPRSAFTS